jgi:hypothetical protein
MAVHWPDPTEAGFIVACRHGTFVKHLAEWQLAMHRGGRQISFTGSGDTA